MARRRGGSVLGPLVAELKAAVWARARGLEVGAACELPAPEEVQALMAAAPELMDAPPAIVLPGGERGRVAEVQLGADAAAGSSGGSAAVATSPARSQQQRRRMLRLPVVAAATSSGGDPSGGKSGE